MFCKGYGYLYASKSGTNWELLTEVLPPAFAEYNYDAYRKMLLSSPLVGKDLYIKVELKTFRPEDGVWVNTGAYQSNLSQFCRHRHENSSPTFELKVQH